MRITRQGMELRLLDHLICFLSLHQINQITDIPRLQASPQTKDIGNTFTMKTVSQIIFITFNNGIEDMNRFNLNKYEKVWQFSF